VSVVGVSGSGKSTLARSIAERLAVPCIELDAIFHQPNWTPLPAEAFLAEVARRTEAEAWVVDGNYRAVVREGPVWERADTVVWLDLPKATAMRQVTWRSLRRAVTREELWNGNRERLRDHLSLDPMRSMPAYVWTFYDRKRAQVEAAMADPAWAHLEFVHLRSHAEAGRWLDALAR
jgi:adenylate kinase family enzyme